MSVGVLVPHPGRCAGDEARLDTGSVPSCLPRSTTTSRPGPVWDFRAVIVSGRWSSTRKLHVDEREWTTVRRRVGRPLVDLRPVDSEGPDSARFQPVELSPHVRATVQSRCLNRPRHSPFTSGASASTRLFAPSCSTLSPFQKEGLSFSPLGIRIEDGRSWRRPSSSRRILLSSRPSAWSYGTVYFRQ